jgi:glycerol-3-phosphate dehydrogenase
MRRAISRLADEQFDILVVGGGITGACIARDAARRGLKTALVEKQDFAGATSAHNSKLIHGGLRYLRNFELGLVRESLRERRVWLEIAPHLVQPLPFLLPLIGGGSKAVMAAGLSLYDLLAYDRNRLDDPAQRLPGHRWLDRKEAIAREPVLDAPGIEGAFEYHDAQMYSPERLALECLIDADAHGAAVANYVAAERLLMRSGRVTGAMVRDGQAPFDVRAKETVIATGPWTDLFLERALGRPASHKLRRSKGIHAIVPARSRAALTVAAEGGHFFVLPWRGHALLGTTDTAFAGDPDKVDVTSHDIEVFFDFINRHLPSMTVKPEEVSYAYAGLRPLVDDGVKSTYGLSRRSEIVDHGAEGAPGLLSVIGGKWTTARALAQSVVDRTVRGIGKRAATCTTATARLPGAQFERFGPFTESVVGAFPSVPSLPHLARLYGSQLPAVLGFGDPGLMRPIGAGGDIAAQVAYAVRHEMAMTPQDVIQRRTGIGQAQVPGPAVIEDVAVLMARARGIG